MKSILMAFGILVLVTGRLFAQESKVQSIEISLYAFDCAKEHQTVFLAAGKGAPYEIALSKANILGPFKTVRGEGGEVVIRTKEKTEEGEVVYPALAKVKLPSQIKEPLIILVPATGASVYRGFVVDRSLSGFPKGSYKLINLSPAEIRGLVGKTRVVAPSKKVTLFNPSSNTGELLEVHFQYKKSGDWKTFGRTRWVKELEKRSLLCAYLEARTQRMMIRGVSMKPIPPLRDRVKQTTP